MTIRDKLELMKEMDAKNEERRQAYLREIAKEADNQ